MKDISSFTGISVAHIGNIENEYVIPSLEVCQKIANFYRISLSQLLVGVNIEMENLLHVGERRRQAYKRYRNSAQQSVQLTDGGHAESDSESTPATIGN